MHLRTESVDPFPIGGPTQRAESSFGSALCPPSSASRSALCAGLTPPVYFRRSISRIVHAYPEWTAWDLKLPRAKSAAAKAGTRFEKTVLAALAAQLKGGASHNPADDNEVSPQTCDLQSMPTLLPGPVFAFTGVENGRMRSGRAIPDFILIDFSLSWILIGEVKLRHSADAWYQLNNFYIPIVRRALPGFYVSGLEICKYYDPDVRLPERVQFVSKAVEVGGLDSRGVHRLLVWWK